MNLTELTSSIRRLEIISKQLSNQIFAGDYHSSFKGRGMNFSEVREYAYGDEVRSIDWNVSARFAAPYIKVFEEERELTMMLLIDISKSSLVGNGLKNKKMFAAEIAATLGFSAISNNDKVGAIFFGDGIVKYFPPKKGKAHLLAILGSLLTMEPIEQTQTNIAKTLEALQYLLKRKSIVFIISDFVSTTFEKPLQHIARRHDLIGLHLHDALDEELPQVGWLPIVDAESGEKKFVNTNNKSLQNTYKRHFTKAQIDNKNLFAAAKAGYLCLSTSADFTTSLHQFFKQRK
jgi:uncharacterized protein (DUF58 family)